MVARVALPGPSVRFDYASLDPAAGRLYIAHMDASQLLVLDVRTRRVIKTVSVPGVHGVLAVPETGRVYASATDARELLTLDARTDAVIAHAPAGQYPDGIAFDPVERHVFVSDESGGIEAARPATCSTTRAQAACSSTFNPATTSRLSIRGQTGSSVAFRSRAASTTTVSSSTRRGGSRSLPATGTQRCSRWI